ncbi:MAG: bifunctional phosphopantothenoylcysteine decarboxylase/phosphopantothenate--cysteine ligase CoaBC [Ardenticatenales bacterium]|nr:bifunctional phosphopantothenoylcysteine decarboxylase/phosphopantothenate--cysteine ligase CoaBC [Ardenticatenales bacterium]
MTRFANKHILLGVSGSIATYKAVALASHLTQEGATVDVIMTEAATRMVQPLSFQAITHRPTQTDMWSLLAETEIGHVTLAKKADALLVAPATANTIAKIALGLADNFLTTTALSLRGALVVAPAMESGMWEHPATQAHIATLRARGAWIVEPESGYLASGAAGVGRLASEEHILALLERALGPNDLRGMRIVITAGGTQEAVDPVRYLSNHSSGRMGYAVAEAAARRGASVVLISGPTALPAPIGVTMRYVTSALEMAAAVIETIPQADALLMAAAVADYRPAEVAEQKIKKKDEDLSIRLVRNPDILLAVKEAKPPQLIVVGWAAESQDLLAYGRDKLERKALDLLIANPVPQSFGGDRVEATLIRPDGHEVLPPLPKRVLAERILDEVRALKR